MKQVQKIAQKQHYLQFSLKISNGDQHQICPSLSNRLIISLCFRRKFFLKNKLDKKQIPPVKKFKNAKKNVIIFTSNLKRIYDLENVEIWFSLFQKKLYIIEFPFKKNQSWINWNFEQKFRAKIRSRCSIIFNFLSKFKWGSTPNSFQLI